MSKTKVFCIPGLGLDHRLFQKLNIPNAELHFIDWKKPFSGENIQAYAKRMAEELPMDEEICLLGVSLGGMISIEIAQFRKIKKLILISTVKNQSEMPKYMNWLDKLPTNSQTAARFGIDASIALKPFYDNADKKGNELFHQMLKDADIDFINWAIHQVARWKFEEEIQTPFIHIHGTNDLIFPIKNIDRAITIKNGTHFMVYNQGEKISKIIEESLDRI
ncbi:MAG: alpha/beta hydrolase [Vicingaceae bacterium]